jgi:ferredoxin-NADP reductase
MAYIIKLLAKREIANGTMAFEWSKPEGYTFTPGQATDWTLVDPTDTDAEGNSRSFSLACAPGEQVLRIATRMRDTAFKRTLKAMPIGGEISIDPAWGEFVLEGDDKTEAVFLCGGIGITPFYSMMKNAVLNNLSQSLTLFFSNKTPQDAPFRDEMNSFATQNKALTVIESMDHPDASWTGEHGYIDKAMLERHLAGLTKPIFYIAGPPQMVAAMNTMLLGAGVVKEHIRLDEFSGY